MVVEDPQVGAEDRSPGGVGGDPEVRGGGRADQPGLGGVVGVVHGVAVPVHERGDGVRAHPRTAGGHEAQRGQAVLLERLRGQVDDPLEHHGYDGQPGRLAAVDQLERRLRVEAATHHDGAAHRRGDRELPEAPRVEHRRRDDGGLAGPPGDPLEHGRERPGGSSRAPRALGGAGRAGGQQHGATGARRLRRATAEVGVDQLVEDVYAGMGVLGILHPGEHLGQVGQPLPRLGEQGSELLVVHHDRGLLALQHVAQLGSGEAGVEQQRVGADARRRGEGLDQTAVVAAQDPQGALRRPRAARATRPRRHPHACRARPTSCSRARRPAPSPSGPWQRRARCRSSRSPRAVVRREPGAGTCPAASARSCRCR